MTMSICIYYNTGVVEIHEDDMDKLQTIIENDYNKDTISFWTYGKVPTHTWDAKVNLWMKN